MKRNSAVPLNMLIGVGIGFLILTILLATSATVMTEFQDDDNIMRSADVYTVTSAPMVTIATWTNNTHKVITGYPAVTGVTIWNSSLTVGSGNYTIEANDTYPATVHLEWSNGANAWYTGGTYYINVTGITGFTSAYNITDNGLEANDTLSQWTPLIALVMAAGVIIASVMFFIGGMRRRE
jgi:hypothetical protein